MFILEHYFTLKSFSTVCEAFSNIYPGREVLNKQHTGNKISGHRLCLCDMCISNNSTIQLQKFNIALVSSFVHGGIGVVF